MELSYQRILVPLDGSQFARTALRTATALADRLGAEVHVVSVAGDDEETEHLRRHAAHALGVEEDDPRVHVPQGDDVPATIQDCADELAPALICLSTHGRGRVSGALVGSVARELLEGAGRPIVAVGRLVGRPLSDRVGAPEPLGVPRVVACVDGTEESEQVVGVAGAWADVLGMSLTLLTVAEPMPAPTRPDSPWHRRHGPDEDADEYVRGLGERHADAAAEVDAVVQYDPISPADGVRDHLAERPAGLVVVTTHARGGLRRLVLGADASAIVAQSDAPVLVVPVSDA